MRVIIAGSRDIDRPEVLFPLLEAAPFPISTVVSGTARGVDALGEEWAGLHGIPVERYKPNWESLGRYAGMVRNREMAQNAEACIVIRFPDSKGSANMVAEAHARGLLVLDMVLDRDYYERWKQQHCSGLGPGGCKYRL